VIVNETFASRFFPGEDPIGRRVDAMGIPELQGMTIVAVVGDTRRGGALSDYTPEMYVPFAQFPQSNATLVVRSAPGRDPLALAGDVRAAVAALDPSTVIGSTPRVSDALAARYGDRRALAWLLGTFAVLALSLTMLGIASVVAFTVAQRSAEIGVRIALGASPRDVVAVVMRGALTSVGVGAVAGLLVLLPLSRLMRSYLFGISPIDPMALGLALTVLMASAALAAWVPARRASRVDPLAALRAS
jgi:putative ABC transport system permease protein